MDYGALFVSADYLEPLQDSGCACEASGWTRLPDTTAPLYAKTHSWGEFVFDFEFANAYAQHGLNYYPKLVCAVPYTPVSGPRFAAGGGADDLLEQMQRAKASSVHVLFAPESEMQNLAAEHWLTRKDLRFMWQRRDYQSFADFLAALASKKRKNIRAERRKVAGLGLQIQWQAAHEFNALEWERIFELYASTYAMRGQSPYLNLNCLKQWAQRLPEQFVFCLARYQGEIQAMAFFFRDDQRLYGRHWGSRIEADSLHFELCYYQGMEYCIEQGLHMFDAGVQGGHRLLRGFEPSLTHSAHHFADARFQQAIKQYLQRESTLLDEKFAELRQQTAFAKQSA